MPIPKNSDKHQINFWLDAATADRLAYVSIMEGKTQSAIIREALAVRLSDGKVEKSAPQKVDDALAALEEVRGVLIDYKSQTGVNQAPPPAWA